MQAKVQTVAEMSVRAAWICHLLASNPVLKVAQPGLRATSQDSQAPRERGQCFLLSNDMTHHGDSI